MTSKLLAQSGPERLQTSVENVAVKSYGSAIAPSLPLLIGQIIKQVLALLGVLFLGLTLYGGYLWMMARGDEKQIEKAKETLKAGVIGLAIMLSAYAISNLVVNAIVGATLDATP